jgi:excisionase family DNA binding protein
MLVKDSRACKTHDREKVNCWSRAMQVIEERRTYSVEEAGRLLGVGRNQAYEAAKTGTLPTIKIGRRLLVPKAALDRMLNGEAAK